MNRSIIIGAVVVIILGVGGFFLLSNSSDDPVPSQSTATDANGSADNSGSGSSNSGSSGSIQSSTAAITYSDDGFSPASLTVKTGTKVTIKNDSSKDLEFSSDPHPVHTDNPELNESIIGPGQSTTFTVTEAGNHGYHNHLAENDTGIIIVQ